MQARPLATQRTTTATPACPQGDGGSDPHRRQGHSGQKLRQTHSCGEEHKKVPKRTNVPVVVTHNPVSAPVTAFSTRNDVWWLLRGRCRREAYGVSLPLPRFRGSTGRLFNWLFEGEPRPQHIH